MLGASVLPTVVTAVAVTSSVVTIFSVVPESAVEEDQFSGKEERSTGGTVTVAELGHFTSHGAVSTHSPRTALKTGRLPGHFTLMGLGVRSSENLHK